MRAGLAATVASLALLIAGSAAGAGPKPGLAGTSMEMTASSYEPGAHGVRLTFTLHYWMQCGYPGAGPLVVTFPKGMRLPDQLASGAVRLAGKPVASEVHGRQVTVTVAPHTGVLCDLMSRGSLKLAFTRLAKLSNPTRAGSYRFAAKHRRLALTAKLVIKPAS